MDKKNPPSPMMHITVTACIRPGVVTEHSLGVPVGACVRDVLRHAQGLGIEIERADDRADVRVPDDRQYGVWGRFVMLDTVLQDQDRLELYRPLLVDPKHARRERFQQQGARGTGLFARRRVGAKMGY